MRKFASKLLMDIFLSVVATVGAAYVTHHYFPGAARVTAPVAAEPTSVGREVAQQRVAASKIPSDVIATVAAATAVADRGTDTNNDEKAGPPPSPAKLFKPAAHRLVPRDKSTIKSNTVVTPKPVQMVAVVPGPSRAAPERGGLSSDAPLAPDAPPPSNDRSERDVAVPPPEMSKPHLAAFVWKPIMRTVAVVAGAFTSHERGRSGE